MATERHSEDMAEYGFFSHISEASSYYPAGASQDDRLALEGYYPAFSNTTENIAFSQLAVQEVVEAWLLSSDHDANMLDGSYTSIGIGHAGPYWTANFGTVA